MIIINITGYLRFFNDKICDIKAYIKDELLSLKKHLHVRKNWFITLDIQSSNQNIAPSFSWDTLCFPNKRVCKGCACLIIFNM